MAIAIFLLTLILALWQPRGIGNGFIAVAGALVAITTGVVTWQDVLTVGTLTWNTAIPAIALVIISLILNEAGFFQWLALWLAKAGFGRGRILFALVILLGASITALLSNFSTALIWTPIVMELLLSLGLGSRAIFAFVFATGFIADTASLPLSISNLVNLISTEYFQISFLRYILVMIPINFVAIATSLGVLWFYCDTYIPPTYPLTHMPPPDSVIRDPLVCQWSFAILGLLLIGYCFAQPLGVSVSTISLIGALGMLALSGRWFHQQGTPVIVLRKVLREAPWQAILFSLGMYVIVFGLRNTALVMALSHLLVQLSNWGLTQAAVGTGFLATLLSCMTNNLPTVLIDALAIQNTSGLDPAVREVMVYANAIGCNIGAKITPIGSLSTLLWLDTLTRKGLHISLSQYMRMAFILTIPVLFVSLLSLAIWLPWLIA